VGRGAKIGNGLRKGKAQNPIPESGFGLGAKKGKGGNVFKRDVPSEAGIRCGGGAHQVSSTDA